MAENPVPSLDVAFPRATVVVRCCNCGETLRPQVVMACSPGRSNGRDLVTCASCGARLHVHAVVTTAVSPAAVDVTPKHRGPSVPCNSCGSLYCTQRHEVCPDVKVPSADDDPHVTWLEHNREKVTP